MDQRKLNKIWIDKEREFYNKSMKSWLEKNDVEMHSTHNEGKSVVAERFVWTLKKNIYKYMTSVSKNVYINKLDYVVDKYNNRYRRTIKIKPVDVKSGNYFEYNDNSNDTDSKFQVGDKVRLLKCNNFFAKGSTSNKSENIHY